MNASKQKIDHLLAATSTLRVRVDALANAAEAAPKDVVESALGDLRAMSLEMKPLAAVASEFRKRWRKQKVGLLEKRQAEVEYHLRQASSAQLARMEAEAEDQIYLMNQDFEARRATALERIHKAHYKHFNRVVDDWAREVTMASQVKDNTIKEAINEQIARITDWAAQEELRIMNIWEQELSEMMLAVHTLDEEEIQAMEGARFARCKLMESTVARQQQELLEFRSDMQGQITSLTNKIMRKAAPDQSKLPTPVASSKRQARTRTVAKKEAEAASQLHIDAAVRYLDEAAALERARVSAYHTSLQEIGPELAEQLQDGLVKETESAGSRSNVLNQWAVGNATSSGLPQTFGGSSNRVMSSGPINSPRSQSEEEDLDDATRLQNEVEHLRSKARSMMTAVGRGEWRKDVLEVADTAIEGLRQTEAALAAGPLNVEKRSPRSTREQLRSIEDYATDFSSSVLKEFTRMRNVKVALSCSRSKHVREAIQQYEWNSADVEEAIMPAVSKLAHEVEVIREITNASKHGKEKMPIYVIAASWRRALMATYPVMRRLWETAEVPDTERKQFIRRLCLTLAVEPSLASIFQAETLALEATLPAPDWAVGL